MQIVSNQNLDVKEGKTMTGQDLKELIKKKRIRQYEVARELNINEFTLSRWLREDMDEEKHDRIYNAIMQTVERVSADE